MSWHQAAEQDHCLLAIEGELEVAIDKAGDMLAHMANAHDLLVDLGEGHPEFHELATHLDTLGEAASDGEGELWSFLKAIQGILAAHTGDDKGKS